MPLHKDNGDLKPIPDPTALTTQQLIREQAGLKELVLSIVAGKFDVIDTRIASTDRSVDREVEHLQKLIESRLAAVEASMALLYRQWEQRQTVLDGRFADRDRWMLERTDEVKMSVNVALTSIKETINEIKQSFTKSLDAQQSLLNVNTRASDKETGDIKDRLTTIESRTAGITTANTLNRESINDSSARVMGILAIAVSLIIGIASVIVVVLTHH